MDIYSELISVDGAFSKQPKWRKLCGYLVKIFQSCIVCLHSILVIFDLDIENY